MDSAAARGEIVFAVQVNSAEVTGVGSPSPVRLRRKHPIRREIPEPMGDLAHTVALDEAAATESRASLERELSAILENSPDAIALVRR